MPGPSVLIVGAGFGGLAMALELRKAGLTEFTVLERADDLGGVWRDNTYPGAGCDIPSPLYSFSTVPNPDWPMRFSLREDIHDYMRRVVDEHGLRPHLRFGVAVEAAAYDEAEAEWVVTTGTGEVLRADVLVPAVGQLSRPALPDIPGMAGFRGPAFHSARWDHGVPLDGKRVAVVGTGASAIQFVPHVAREASRLTVFQRSAPWVLPKPDVRYRPWHKRLFRRLPLTRLVERFAIWLLCEVLALGLVDLPVLRKAVAWLAGWHLRHQVADPGLRAKLTPDYAPGCKRALFSNDFYPAMTRPNVELVTEKITEITTGGVRTADGIEHPADVIIYGTGFAASEFLAPIAIRGRGGRALAEAWSNGARAYLGMTVPGFPNLFLMYGPNTNLGVGSIIYMLESQARYVVDLLRTVRPGRALEVRAEVADRFDREIQARLRRSVWTLCSSWYRDQAGRITNNWPGTVTAYRVKTRRAERSDYHEHG
ncbi:flavin-containing monooxygenase [Labedaea rhizosphaerae]|uniref:Cation diffusion facilitator CzcD-associated flavoprotein CzcO n=1 Tax=Labedaea rhizosphaerae TaxID=598644 RepID=A0A4R6SIG7_LABRH|nr:NAD(P)/FAD-dependent oxidoreductase [Labedaea rhizosphaerae]TDQ01390.1 cation diffusion facilitator CzcD-associated flavoprotein CzcO [Labedaea rhizosphaerae]